jgi:hypothetical protein
MSCPRRHRAPSPAVLAFLARREEDAARAEARTYREEARAARQDGRRDTARFFDRCALDAQVDALSAHRERRRAERREHAGVRT